jgi:WD40 repeat protein
VLILRGHTDAIRCLSYSPNGRYLASGSEDNTARLWDFAAGGSLTATLEHPASVETLGFAPDGDALLTGTSAGKLHAWDLASQNEQASAWGSEQGIRSLLHISNKGDGEMLVTAGWDRSVKIWNYPMLAQRPFKQIEPQCVALSWDPIQRRLAIGEANGNVILYDLDTRSIRRNFGSLLPLSALAWSPDGQLLAFGHTDGTVNLCSLPLLEGSRRLDGHTWTIYALAFTPDSRTLISGGADSTVRLWDVATGREKRCFRWHKSWVTCAAVAPDGMTAAAGSADHTLVVWDLDED